MVLFRDRKAREVPGQKKQSFKGNFKEVFKVKDVWFSSLFYAFRFVATSSLLALLPLTLSERGLSSAKAGAFVAIMMGMSSLFKIVGGTASDRLGRRKPFLIICSVVQGVCVFAFATFSGVPLIIALVITGAAMGCIAPIFLSSLVEIKGIGPSLAGTTVGLVFMIGNFAGFLGPIISGKLMDVSGSQWPGFLFMGLAYFVAACVILPVKDTGSRKRGATTDAV
jgi:OFA family oxalate/formate antiporter-like MFS transporter